MRPCLLWLLGACGFTNGTPLSSAGDGAPPSDARGDARVFDGPSDASPDGAPDAPPDAPIPVAFVQGSSTNNSGNSISLQLNTAETAGDVNVVGASWATTSVTVTSVSDTDGNTYTQLGSTLVLSGAGVLAAFYAPNVKHGAAQNTVTVQLSGTTSPILMVAEYGGLALASPLDVTSQSKASSGTAASSSGATTTHAHDLLVGVGAAGANMSPGSGYTNDVPAGLDLIEHREVTSTGSYDATATLSSSNGWTMIVAAFKARN